MRILYICLVLAVLGTIFTLFLIYCKKKHENFVSAHSKAIKELRQLNDEYRFFEISDYYEKHTYDNEKLYDAVSCEDYLIYQLQFNEYKVAQQLDNVRLNRINYSRYCQSVSKIKRFGVYDLPKKKYSEKLLISIEAKLFEQEEKMPDIEFNAHVNLYLSRLNGDIYRTKHETFNAEQIKTYIRRLDDRNGTFYNDRGIWDSICRVERAKVSNKMRFSIYERDGYRCRICGRTENQDYLEIDHIQPIAKGGKSTYDNLQTLCRRCNKEKGDRY